MRAIIACCAMTTLGVHAIQAAEVCRYAGTTSYSGHVLVETWASSTAGETSVDVTARVNAKSFGVFDWQYLYQEIGTWHDGALQSIGVNHRYSALGSIRRQQWDVFRRTPAGMTAYRVEANTLADFQNKHPGFARHWEPASFGAPWLRDYAAASPDRRADLDLPRAELPPGLGTPLVLAFWWVRWAGASDRTVPVFLPGFKHNARVDVHVASLGVEAGGLLHLRSTVRHPQLSDTRISTGDAWIAPDHHLVRIAFDALGDHGSARGELRLEGCQGQTAPP